MKNCSVATRAALRRAGKRSLPLLAALALGSAALPAWADCKVRSIEIPVRLVNARPIATVSLNGVEVPMLVDSGAFYSLLSESTAAQLKLPLHSLPPGFTVGGHTGDIEAKLTRVAKVGIQGAQLTDVEFIVGGNELGSGIMGILGRNFLSGADTEYDLAHGMVRLMFPIGDCQKTNLAYWAGEAPVIVESLSRPRNRQDTAARVIVKVNDTRLRALLDTGAPVTGMQRSAALRAGIPETEMKLAGRVGGAGAGRARLWTSTVPSFELGGEKVANNQFIIDDTSSLEHDMIIGLDYFLSHRVYISRLQGKFYATWNGGPVFARDGTAGEYDPRHAAVPAEIAADNADGLAVRAAASVVRGDYASALKDLDLACAAAPTMASHFLARAQVRLALRQPREALKDFDEALRLEPGLAEARMGRASLRQLSNRAGTEADLLALDSTLAASAPLRARMAALYAQLNLVPEALRQWELWLPTHGNDIGLAGVLNQRCWLRARMNLELPKALQDCKRAVDLDRDEASYRGSLGWTYLRMEETSSAKKAFDAAIALKPLPLALYGRALALQRQGNADAAQADLEAARKLRPKIDDEVRKAGFEPAASGPAS